MKDVLTKTKPEAIVHCAHDLSHSPKNSNIELIQRWFSDAADFGIVNQVYLSSISAIPNASSKYGREKHAIEHLAIGHGMTVFRPGLVVGNGGVFGNLMNLARKHAIIPMIDSGHTCTQWIDIMELCQAIHQMVISRPTVTHRKSTYEMHHGEQVSLKKMVQLIRGVDHKPIILPVPYWFIYGFLIGLEKLGLRIKSVSSENVIGLKQNHDYQRASDLDCFQMTRTTLEASINDAVTSFIRKPNT